MDITKAQVYIWKSKARPSSKFGHHLKIYVGHKGSFIKCMTRKLCFDFFLKRMGIIILLYPFNHILFPFIK